MKFFLILAGGTIVILLVSWHYSLKGRRYHGLARFFCFESILLLILLNVPFWFARPLSIRQVVSFILLTLSLVLVLHGFYMLRRRGKPEASIETTTQLVISGAYRFIRHPLYASLILLGTGVFLKHISGLTIALAAVNVLAAWVTARVEEKEMLAKFGSAYTGYMKRTRMFIPFVL